MWNTYIASAAASRNVRLSAGVRGVSYVGGRGVRVRGRGIEGTDASRIAHAYTRSPNRAEKALTSRRGLFNFS